MSLRISKTKLATLSAALLALVGCGSAEQASEQGSQTVTQQRIEQAADDGSNWLAHGRTYSEQRFSPLKQVNDKNVDELGLAWSFKYDLDRVVEATPVVVDGVMYTTGAFSMVYALDATNGKLLWKYDPKVDRGIAGTGCCDAANRGVAVWGDKVYVGVYDGRLEAIDAKTGKLAWSTDTVIDHERNYTISGAPRVVKGKVIIGNGGAEFGVRGYVTAYDAETGKQVWRFYTVPGDPAKPAENKAMEIAQKTWFGDKYWKQGGGGTAWDSMAYDPELDLFYIGVGNASLWNYKARSEAKGDNLFVSSIVAVKPDTGEYVWHYQTTPGDAWDYTATQTITVATLPIDGKPRKVVMQAPKNGFFYVLDAATGEFISAEKFGMVNWAHGIDKETGRPIVNEEIAHYWKQDQAKIVMPGSQGAHNWPPMSYNPQTGLVYIPQQVTMESLKALPDEMIYEPMKGLPNLGLFIPEVPTTKEEIDQVHSVYKGKLQAWDPVAQKEVWSFQHDHIQNGGTLSTAGNLVFQGTADGRVAAYSADKGEKLWEFEVTSGVGAGPITYSVDGEQYVAFNVGYGGAFAITFGVLAERTRVIPDSRLYVFKLGGNAKAPEVKRREIKVPELVPDTATEEEIAGGRMFYDAHCGVCHGLGGIGSGILPDLRLLTKEKHEQFMAIVYGARADKGMPNFSKLVPAERVDLIQKFVIRRAHELKASMDAEKKAGKIAEKK